MSRSERQQPFGIVEPHRSIGRIIGKIIEVRDSRVLVKVDENSNTKIWFSRNAIHRVLTEEKAEAAK